MPDHKKTFRPPTDATENALFDALSAARWSQETRLGRSVVTEVVDKIEGTITTTERRFVSVDGDGDGDGDGEPKAYLVRTIKKLPPSDDT